MDILPADSCAIASIKSAVANIKDGAYFCHYLKYLGPSNPSHVKTIVNICVSPGRLGQAAHTGGDGGPGETSVPLRRRSPAHQPSPDPPSVSPGWGTGPRTCCKINVSWFNFCVWGIAAGFYRVFPDICCIYMLIIKTPTVRKHK